MDKKASPQNTNEFEFNWQMAEVLDNINIGFFSKDIPANKYISLSEGCPRIYGYTLADFYSNGSLWYDVILDEDKHLSVKESEALARGDKSVAEYRINHRDGTIRWVEVRTLPIFRDENLIRVEGIVYDITDRKNAEIQMIRAKELSDQIINSLPGIFYLFDEQGRYLKWNKNFEDKTGFTAHEVEALGPLDMICPDDREAVSLAMGEVFSKGSSEVEARLLSKSGQCSTYFFNGQMLVVDGKNCIAGMGIDITEKRAAIDTLRKNEQMLSHIFNVLPQAIFWKDANFIFQGGNAVFAGLLGQNDISTVIGKSDFEFSSTRQEAIKYQQEDFEVMRSRKARMHYIESQTLKNGRVGWLETSKIPLVDEDGQATGVLVVIEDITEKKKREDQQNRMNEDLIQKNIGLKEFSYIVSHNLRAPIAKILGLTSMFEKDDPSSPVNSEIIELVSNEASGLDTIVKDLNIILAHQSSGGKLIETVSLEELIADLKKQFVTEINQSEATVTCSFDSVKTVDTVRSYLYSIMNNLISNSLKFRHPDRKPDISVTAFITGDFTCITVEDNGLGLDLAKYGDRVFGLYNNFHKQASPGTGIGLKLAKTQVEALGGKIELESSLGKGSMFKVCLPLEPVHYW